MNELLSFYQKQAEELRSAHPLLAKLQRDALNEFMKRGFPTRRDEAWKYSPPDLFLQQRFNALNVGWALAQHDASSVPNPADKSRDTGGKEGKGLLGQGSTYMIENGIVIRPSSCPEGIWMGTFEETLNQRPGLLEPYLTRLSKAEHGFHDLNTAMLQTSFVIYVPRKQSIRLPLTIAYWQNQAEQAVHSRCIVILEQGAEFTLIEDYNGEQAYFTHSMTEVFLAEDTSFNHVQIQRESPEAIHFSHLFINQQARSRCNSHAIQIGAKWARSDKSIFLQGQKASCLLNGVYGLKEKQHIDQHTTIHHDVPECTSEQDYKGVLAGPSRAVFNGRVVVQKGAEQTQARQQNKNLLLSQNAEIDTKPQLEIFNNDVICSHGATVGQISEEALFYFLSRGIDKEEAIRFLVDAFTAPNLACIEDQSLREWISDLLHTHLQGA